MKNYKLPLFFIVLVSLAFCAVPCRAEDVSNSQQSSVPKNGKTYSDPSEAAIAGYKVGQTVMVKNGIKYKLYQDSKTGKYFYKRYRVVKKKKTDTLKRITPSPKNKKFFEPEEAAAAGYKVGQTVMMKDNIKYKLARNSKTGKYTYKRYRVVKSKKVEPPKMEQADTAKKVQAKPNPGKPTSEASKAQAEVDLKGSTETGAQQDTTENDGAGGVAEAKETKQEPKERLQTSSEPGTPAGRNIGRLAAAVSFRHAFLDRETEITDWSQTNSIGETTSQETGGDDSTDMHSDILRLRLGLTNSIEVFLDAGCAYDKLSGLSDMEPAFGGGFRANLATVESGFFSGVYLAFVGEYLQGKLKTSSDSSDGTVTSTSETEIDWQDMTATMESGITFSKITIFAGCSYMLYSEDITTTQANSLAVTTLLEEELEQKNSLNFSCGAEYHYSPSLSLQLEIQAPSRLGGIMSAEYRF